MVNIHGKRLSIATYITPELMKELRDFMRKEYPGVNQWKSPLLRNALEEYAEKRRRAVKKTAVVPAATFAETGLSTVAEPTPT